MNTDRKYYFLRSGKFILFLCLSISLFSCKNNERQENEDNQQTEIDTTQNQQVEVRAFTGKISPVTNSKSNVSGEIAMRIEGDLMRFNVTAEGLAPDLMHMQYLLASQTGDDTQCPQSIEEAGLGNQGNAQQEIKRIPLHMEPYSLKLDVDTYPRTNANGELQFTHTISLDSLRSAVRTEYGMEDLDFTKLTFVIRGVPDSASNRTGQSGNQSTGETPVGCAKLQETAVSN